MKAKSIFILAVSTCMASSMAFAAPRTNTSVKLQQMEKHLAAMQSQLDAMKKSSKGSPTHKRKLHRLRSRLSRSVVIAPFTSAPTYYSGGQLIVNAPGINEDAKLLYRRMLDINSRLKVGAPLPPSPRLVLSGKVEGKVSYTNPYAGRHSTDINLSGAELDAFAEITKWVNGFMAFAYDDGVSNKSAGTVGGKRRISNSRIHLDKGFLTIGNFRKSGFYGSIGQMTVPFGRYSSSMITSPITENIGETKARAIVVSYIAHNPLQYNFTPYGHLFLFKGDAKYGKHDTAKNYGGDLGFWAGSQQFHGNLGVSYLQNIADANDMQDNSRSSGFQGFEQTANAGSENLTHRVGGADIHGNISYGPYSGLAEYVTALQRFGASNMSFNGHGAKPSAIQIEGAYTFKTFNMPSSVAVGYQRSREAMALSIPLQRYIASYQITFLTNTTFTIEANHDINYGKRDWATGDTMTAFNSNERGQASTGVAAKVGVYF